MPKIVVLTGAGISAESGIPTFRGSDGLWEGHAIEKVASLEGFSSNPDLVYEFYNQRRRQLLSQEIFPNAAHQALANWEQTLPPGDLLVVTQNVDNLHERAGSKKVIHMHGELLKARCVDTGEVFEWPYDLTRDTPHPRATKRLGRLRPHIVWFGETPLHMNEILEAVRHCDWFIAIGTSGKVYPAANLVDATPSFCRRVLINLDASDNSDDFQEIRLGAASIEVPKFIRSCEVVSTDRC
jgi:NAD-dependent deacetylase